MPHEYKHRRDETGRRFRDGDTAPGGGTVVRPGPGGVRDAIGRLTGGIFPRLRGGFENPYFNGRDVYDRLPANPARPNRRLLPVPPQLPAPKPSTPVVQRPAKARKFSPNLGAEVLAPPPRRLSTGLEEKKMINTTIPAVPGVPHTETVSVGEGAAPKGMIDAHETSAASGRDRNYIKATNRIVHPTMGHGVRYKGKQPFANIVSVDGLPYLMAGTNLASTSYNTCVMVMDNLNGPLAGQANFHQQYRFNWIKWHYVTTASTSTAFTLAMAFDRDPACISSTTVATTFALTRQYSDNEMFPVWQNESHLKINFDSTNPIRAIRASSVGEPNESSSGVFVIYPSTNGSGAVNYGFLDIEYSIDMYGDCGGRGIAFATINAEERLILRTIFDKMVELRRVIVPTDPKKPPNINFEQVAKFLLTKVNAPPGSGEDGLMPTLKALDEKKEDKKSWF